MARIYEPTAEQEALYQEFVDSRPKQVREVAARFRPWELYRLGSTGHRCTIYSFDEDKNGSVTLKVDVTGEYNQVAFARRVFGISPDDLQPCELPAANEELGEFLSQDEVHDNLPALREMMAAWKVGVKL